MSFIMVWKVAGLLVRPKNINQGLKEPSVRAKAAFHSSPSLMRTLCIPSEHPTVSSVHPETIL